MKTAAKKSGFTLTEVMLAAAILAIGFVLIAGAFPVGAKLTATATERSIAAVTADEAFAKIQLYGLNMSSTAWSYYPALSGGQHFDYSELQNLPIAFPAMPDILDILNLYLPDENEYYYPTTKIVPQEEKIYHWSALCKRDTLDPTKVLVTVFVSRLGNIAQQYPANDLDWTDTVIPAPITVPEPYMVQGIDRDPDNSSSLVIPSGYETYFREGAKILDDSTGEIFVIQNIQIDTTTSPSTYYAVLDRNWPYPDFTVDGNYENVWIIPSAMQNSASTPYKLTGRWPCVGVFQRIIEFK